jgi:hypothetical protein
MTRTALLLVALTLACSSGSADGGTGGGIVPGTGGGSAGGGTGGGGTIPVLGGETGTRYFGDSHSGNFWLGPVDFAETEWNNACSPSNGPYPQGIQQLYGNYLMGVANEVKLDSLVASEGQLCDTCAELTANGVTLIARVITYGQETGPNDIDVSPEAREALHGATSYKLTWRFVTCPTQSPIVYTFDDRDWSNTWYFRVWIRNARVPVAKVEYKLGSKAYATADWQSDGAWQAASADFSRGFSLRVTSIEGATIEDALPGIGTFDANAGILSQANFQ